MTAPAKFIGVQSGFGLVPDIELFNLTADIPDHPRGSTVSRETLESAGFTVPPTSQLTARVQPTPQEAA